MAKKAEVIITCDGSQVKRVLEEIDSRVKLLTANREQLRQKMDQGIRLTKEEIKQDKAWEQELKALTSAQKNNQAEYQRLRDIMKDLANAKVKDLKRALRDLQKMLNEVAESSPKRAEVIRSNIDKVQKKIQGITGETGKFGKTHNAVWQTAVRNITAYMGVFAAFNYVKNKMTGMVKDNLALSDSMAQVQKVTGLTSEEVKMLNEDLSKLDTRSTLTQLNELAYTAGKMGLGKYGVEGIQGFVNAANQLQVALGEDLGSSVEEAILPVAKLGENLGLFERLGTEKAVLSIGSAINELSQTTTAAGRNIVDFARRVQPSAQMIGLTTDQILALGSASDSFGVASEVAATAFTKFLAAYRTNTAEIERILGIAQGTLDQFFDEGRTIDGLMTIFQRMHEIGDLRYLEEAFKALGSEGSKMFVTFGAFSKNIDMFREHLATSTKAFEEATSVTREYNLVQETAQGIIERSNNIWKNAFVNPEGVDAVKQLADEWYRLSKELTSSETWMFQAKSSLGLILEAVKLLIQALPTLIRLMMAYGVGAALQGIVKNFNAIYRAVTIANSGLTRFDLLLKTNAIAIAVTLLGYIATKFIDTKLAADKATDAVNKNQEALRRSQRVTDTYNNTMSSSYANLMDKYDKLKREWNSLKTQQEKNKWIKDNKDAFGELGLSISNAASAEDIFEKNTARVVDGFKRRAEAAALAAQMTELYSQRMEIETEAGEQIRKYGKKAGDKAINQSGSFTRDENGRTFNNGQFTLEDDGAYHYTDKGALEYNRQLIKSLQQEYDKLGQRIDSTAKRMQDLGNKQGSGYVPPTGDTGGNGNDKKALQEAKQAMRKEMEDAQKESTGVLSKLEEWYRLQEAAITEARADGKMTEEQATQMIRALSIIKNESLATARRAITSGDTEAWDELKNNVMPKAMADASDLSQNLLETIQNVPVKALHDNLAKFNGDAEKVFGLDSRAFFDQINAKAAGNTREAARLRAKMFKQAEKLLEQYEMVRVAQKKMQTDLEGIGLYTETYEEFAQRMQQGITEKQPKQLKNGKTITDEQAYGQMGAKFIGQGTIPYKINIENADEALQWLHDFATNAKGELEDWAQAFPDIEKWVTLLQRKNELQEHGRELTTEELAEMSQIPEKLAEAIPVIRAMFYQLESSANNVAETIMQQVDKMYERKPIGIDEMQEQHEGKVREMNALWQEKIDKANSDANAPKNADGDTNAAVELKKQRDQELIDLEYQYQQELWQIREQMGVNVFEQYENEVAMYKNMLDKKLITEKQFQQKKGQLQMKLGLNVAQQYNGMMSDMINALQEAEIASVEAKYDAEIQAAQANGQDTTALEEQKEAEIMGIRKKYAGMQFAVKISEIIANTAVAIMQAYAQLGPIGGSIAAAMLTVTGAAQLALAKAEYDKVMGMQAGGSKKSASSANTNIKLASGMLTYKEGNVQRFIGQDGKVYTATEEPAPKDGLVTHPIATTVQGQPALVAENGPEIVVGRETTRAIMMNEPELIRYLANYQKNGGGYRPYDCGNLGSEELRMKSEEFSAADNGQSSIINGQLLEVMQGVLYYLQNPIPPEIAMYDTGGKKGLHSKMKEANNFMARYGG